MSSSKTPPPPQQTRSSSPTRDCRRPQGTGPGTPSSPRLNPGRPPAPGSLAAWEEAPPGAPPRHGRLGCSRAPIRGLELQHLFENAGQIGSETMTATTAGIPLPTPLPTAGIPHSQAPVLPGLEGRRLVGRHHLAATPQSSSSVAGTTAASSAERRTIARAPQSQLSSPRSTLSSCS